MSLIIIKEVIKTTTLRVTKRLWLHIIVAALVSLPAISVLADAAQADYVPPSDSGQSGDGNGRFGSSR
ncbi:MAG: hypothetical protein ACFB14_05835 [Leptolyngbyaceae cyanobacterium]